VAPYEADAQLTYLYKSGIVQVVATEDSDLLAFGVRKVLFKLDKNGIGNRVFKKFSGYEINLDNLGYVEEMNYGSFD
jgi:exonuclease-1